jgi:protein-disulfide isomerase
MMKMNRRNLFLGVAAATIAPLATVTAALAQDKMKPDPAKLNAPSAIGEMVLGPDTAKVTIIEYASSSCPHCRDFFNNVFVPLRKDYIDTGKVRFILREFPHNDLGLAGFMVARCAPKEKYFPIVDVLFETQDKWLADPVNQLKNIGKQAGMTEEQVDACLKNEAVAKGILDVRKGGDAIGIEGIPAVYINGERFDDRTFEGMKAKIDPMLAG